jgi:hypothetical protein
VVLNGFNLTTTRILSPLGFSRRGYDISSALVEALVVLVATEVGQRVAQNGGGK